MIEREDLNNEEEETLKVTDKRKFNVDGSLREGVTIEPEEPRSTPEPEKESAQNMPVADESAAAPLTSDNDADAGGGKDADQLEDENPASFVNFLSTLVTNAAASLGAMPHPVTGQKTVDLETAKYWIDVLSMLREKTKDNLNSQEQHLLNSILSDLQMQYVSLVKASEQKLKAQASQKFSSKDILGK